MLIIGDEKQTNKNPLIGAAALVASGSQDKSIGHWRFSCVMSFPWRPILSGDSSSLLHV
jgi:hypothetical protein